MSRMTESVVSVLRCDNYNMTLLVVSVILMDIIDHGKGYLQG